MFAYRFALAMGEPDVECLKRRLTREQWENWEQFYAADPWGEMRNDLRAMAALIMQWGQDSETRLVWPYWKTEAEVLEDIEQQKQLAASFDPAVIEEKFAKARQEHFAAKEKKHG